MNLGTQHIASTDIKYFITAYSFVWVIIFGYLISLHFKVLKAEKKVAEKSK